MKSFIVVSLFALVLCSQLSIAADTDTEPKTKGGFSHKLAISLGVVIICVLIQLGSKLKRMIQGNTLPSEMADNLQYMFGGYCDRSIRAVFTYDFKADRDIIMQAAEHVLKSIPVLHSSFKVGLKTYWSIQPICIQNVVTFKEVSDESELQAEQDKFMLTKVDPSSPLQLSFCVLYHGDKTTICVLVSHMCTDVASFKYVLGGFCDTYSKLAAGQEPTDIVMGDRAYTSIYENMSPEDKKAVKKLLSYKNTKDTTSYFPFTPVSDDDHPMIVKRKMSDILPAIVSACKKSGSTVNDVLLTSYIYSLYEVAGFKDDQQTTISCAIDLRRHLGSNPKPSVTNHISWLQCVYPKKGSNILEAFEVTKETMDKFKSDRFIGLYGLPKIASLFVYFPYALAKFLMLFVYSAPPSCMSNMGVLNSKSLSLAEHEPADGYVTGPIKYKPCVTLSCTTLRDDITMALNISGSEKDRETMEKFFDIFVDNTHKLIEEINKAH